jgi:hypothetical protein
VHLPVKTLDQAIAIRDWLIANRTPLSAKKILTQFSACCNWAVKSQLIEDNPFEDMASDIKVPKGDSEETDINPFSVEERDRILLEITKTRTTYVAQASQLPNITITNAIAILKTKRDKRSLMPSAYRTSQKPKGDRNPHYSYKRELKLGRI